MSESNRPSAPSAPAADAGPKSTANQRPEAAEPSGPTRSSLRLRAPLDGEHDAWPEYAKVPTASARALVGQLLDGRYRVEAVLGIGAMGVVYRCRHEHIGRTVAVKVIREDLAGDTEATDRFVREAKAATAVGSPHIVETLDFGRLADGTTYFVMEHLDGRSLADLLAEGRLEPERTRHIARQVAEALDDAHHAGIIHRDLKPDNVFVLARPHADFVKILDFGIAKVASAENKLTRAGAVFGTPHYMSPEQACGLPVDHRADVYALGVMLYEMLAGRVPFDGDGPMAIMSQHVHAEPVPPSAVVSPTYVVPAGLESIALRCLQKLPGQRYQSMAEVIEELDAVARGSEPESLRERPKAEPAVVASSAPARRAAFVAAVASGVVAAATVVTIAVSSGRANLSRSVLALPPEIDSALQAARDLTSEVDQPAPLHDGRRQVAVVVSPIDAEVWQSGRNLGVMPVTVEVSEGQRVTIEVRRRGYRPEHLDIDGTHARVVVRLSASPELTNGSSQPAPSALPPAIPPSAAAVVEPPPPLPQPLASAGEPAAPTPPPATSAPSPAPSPAPPIASADHAAESPPAPPAGPVPRLPAELHPDSPSPQSATAPEP